MALNKVSYIQELDGLRGIAVLMVLLGHMPTIDVPYLGYFIAKSTGFLHLPFIGVDIFFCLSGFLITRIILSEKKQNIFSFRIFWIKRALRIFPIYFLTVGLIYIFINREFILPLLFYYSNYAFALDSSPHPLRHTWSLAVEEHYYLFLPLVMLVFSANSCQKILTWTVAAIVFFVLFLVFSGKNHLQEIDKFSHVRFLTLISGSLIAFQEFRLHLTVKNMRLLIVGIILIFVLIPLLRFQDNINIYISLRVIGYWLFSTGLMIFIVAISKQQSYSIVLKKTLKTATLKYLGQISYGIYLYHLPILYILGVSHMDGNPIVGFGYYLVILTLILVTSIVSYNFIERPFLSLKTKLRVNR